MSVSAAPALIPDELRALLESRLKDGKFELPILPDVSTKVLSATRDEKVDLRQLAALVTRDQAMAAHLLRLANSGMFNTGVPIVSLQQALSRLGMERVRQIAMVIALQGTAFIVPGRMREMRLLFRHALATAFMASEIARLKRRNVEEAYLAGLFHDVGCPVLMQTLAKLEKKSGQAYPPAVHAAVIEEYRANTGALLLQHWGLPAALREAVLHHRDPEQAGADKELVLVTQFGVALGWFALEDPNWTEETIRQHPAAVPLNIYPDDLDLLLLHCQAICSLVHDLS